MEQQQGPFFYREKVKKMLWKILIASCILPVMVELFFLHRHSHFAESGWHAMDGIFSFYAIMGFIGCSILILVAKLLAIFLKAGETYYNDDF